MWTSFKEIMSGKQRENIQKVWFTLKVEVDIKQHKNFILSVGNINKSIPLVIDTFSQPNNNLFKKLLQTYFRDKLHYKKDFQTPIQDRKKTLDKKKLIKHKHRIVYLKKHPNVQFSSQ